MSNLVNVNGISSDPAPFGASLVPQPGPTVIVKTAEDVRQESLSRQEVCRRAVEALGITMPATIVPEGSALIVIGTAKLKRDRAAWDAMPLAASALPIVQEALKSEQRKDYTELIQNLRLRPSDGRIVRAANLASDPKSVPGLAYTDHALRQILGQAGILSGAPKGFAAALAYVNNSERATVVNRLILEAAPGKETVLRTRLPHQGSARVVRAALSERYADANDVQIAEILQSSGLPEGTRLAYLPGDSASAFDLVFPSQISVDAIRAGDVHKAGIRARNSETGQGSASIRASVTRILCVNLTLGDASGECTSVRHIGEESRVRERIRTALRTALDSLEPLLEAIGYSASLSLDAWTVSDALRAIAQRYGVSASASATWEAQHKASQYPATIWGLTSAITEAARAN